MEFIDNDVLRTRIDLKVLIEELRETLQSDSLQNPERWVLPIATKHGAEASLLIMPVWKEGEGIVVKIATYFPENGKHNLPTIHAAAIGFDGQTGQAQGLCDADILTARRTAAGSALAADYLARKDARHYLLLGTGQLAIDVVKAHVLMRSYEKISIWGRNLDKAKALTADLGALGIEAEAVTDLQMALGQADVISSVTSSTTPLIEGRFLKAGTHVDLIGSFRADMRESDDELMQMARIFVDNRDNALKAGDLAQPLDTGVITKTDIIADLKDLATHKSQGRQAQDDITVFKSAGFALEDYVAMRMAMGQS